MSEVLYIERSVEIHQRFWGFWVCRICYDSEYAANQAQGFHKAHKNIELSSTSKVILMEARLKREIRFLHVKGHSGHQWNDAADAAANLGAAGQTTPSEGIAT